MNNFNRILFVLPGLFVAGGIRFIFNISDALIKKGLDVSIVYPRQLEGRLAKIAGPKITKHISRLLGVRQSKSQWLSTKAKLFEIPEFTEKYLPDADAIFATAWTTADFVSSLAGKDWLKCYLIQHYETWSGDKADVDKTWRLPLKKVVVAGWLKDLAASEFGDNDARVVNLGVDHSVFWVDEKHFNEKPKVGMMYHKHYWKGCSDGFKAISIAKEHVDFDVVLFGAHKPETEIISNYEFHFNPSQDKLREIYQKCDVFLSPSWLEGGPMPPMEAMACGCAVVATNSRGILEYAIHEENALLSEPECPEKLAESLIRVLSDPELLYKLSASGRQRIKDFTWERSAEQFISALNDWKNQ